MCSPAQDLQGRQEDRHGGQSGSGAKGLWERFNSEIVVYARVSLGDVLERRMAAMALVWVVGYGPKAELRHMRRRGIVEARRGEVDVGGQMKLVKRLYTRERSCVQTRGG